jgi:hypothetical protein
MKKEKKLEKKIKIEFLKIMNKGKKKDKKINLILSHFWYWTLKLDPKPLDTLIVL